MFIAIAGLTFLFYSIILGLGVLVLVVFFFLPKRMRELNLKKKLYREGLFFNKMFSNKWKPFPKDINYISVMRLKQKSTIQTTVGISTQSSTNIYVDYQVNLIYNKRKKFRLATTDTLDEALKRADLCVQHLKLDTFIVQPGEKYWKRYTLKS